MIQTDLAAVAAPPPSSVAAGATNPARAVLLTLATETVATAEVTQSEGFRVAPAPATQELFRHYGHAIVPSP